MSNQMWTSCNLVLGKLSQKVKVTLDYIEGSRVV